MKLFYIGACNKPLALGVQADKFFQTGAFTLADAEVQRMCKTGKLQGCRSHEQAMSICRDCPEGRVQPYLEKAATDEDLRPTAAAPAPAPAVPTAPRAAPAPALAPAPAPATPKAPGLPAAPPMPVDEGLVPIAPQAAPNIVDEAPQVPAADPPQPIAPGQLKLEGTTWDKPGPLNPLPVDLLPPPDLPADAQALFAGFDFEKVKSGPRLPEYEGAPPDFNDILPAEIRGGPSVFGWSTISTFRTCMRKGYYQHVLGLHTESATEREATDWRGNPTVKFNPLQLGILVHAALERYWRLDVEEAPTEFIKRHVEPYYPNIADEATRLAQQFIEHKGDHYRERWDVRAIELESRLYFPKRTVKTTGKKVSICMSARHDLIVRSKEPGEAILPPGEPAPYVSIVDWKTRSAITAASQVAFRHDAAVLQNFATFNHGVAMLPDGSQLPAREVFGPARYFVAYLIGKAQRFDLSKHLKAVEYAIPERTVEGYIEDTQRWVYEEFAPRFFRDAARQPMPAAEKLWPKEYLGCKSPITDEACPFAPICEAGGLEHYEIERTYKVAEDRKLTPERITAPEKKRTRRRKRKAAADTDEK